MGTIDDIDYVLAGTPLHTVLPSVLRHLVASYLSVGKHVAHVIIGQGNSRSSYQPSSDQQHMQDWSTKYLRVAHDGRGVTVEQIKRTFEIVHGVPIEYQTIQTGWIRGRINFVGVIGDPQCRMYDDASTLPIDRYAINIGLVPMRSSDGGRSILVHGKGLEQPIRLSVTHDESRFLDFVENAYLTTMFLKVLHDITDIGKLNCTLHCYECRTPYKISKKQSYDDFVHSRESFRCACPLEPSDLFLQRIFPMKCAIYASYSLKNKKFARTIL